MKKSMQVADEVMSDPSSIGYAVGACLTGHYPSYLLFGLKGDVFGRKIQEPIGGTELVGAFYHHHNNKEEVDRHEGRSQRTNLWVMISIALALLGSIILKEGFGGGSTISILAMAVFFAATVMKVYDMARIEHFSRLEEQEDWVTQLHQFDCVLKSVFSGVGLVWGAKCEWTHKVFVQRVSESLRGFAECVILAQKEGRKTDENVARMQFNSLHHAALILSLCKEDPTRYWHRAEIATGDVDPPV